MITDRIASRLLGLSPAHTTARRRQERITMRDGVVLLAEHHVPATDRPRGTVLIRSPYGRRTALDVLSSRAFAVRGYHVLVQSVRGTFGSGGVFDPMVDEERDGHDTVAWLRAQPWFDGRLATYGPSYLGWTQWALMADPPPELKAAVVLVGPHDFAASVYGTGAFALHGFLSWSDLIVTQATTTPVRALARGLTAARRLEPGFGGLPIGAAVDTLLAGHAPWFRSWLAHDDLADPFWDAKRAPTALTHSPVPTLLIGGWQDLFVEQTVAQYTALHARGTDVGLTVGPWTHIGIGLRGAGPVARETLAWLDEHVAATGGRARRTPVRAYQTGGLPDGARPAGRRRFGGRALGHRVSALRRGAQRWHELAAWPPPTTPREWWLAPAGRLVDQGPQAAPSEPVATFRYDPADPTPAVGGRLLTPAAGVRDNRALAARADVVAFTSPPLAADLVVAGAPTVTLTHDADPAFADLFVRLCDAAPDGELRNFSDGMIRRSPATGSVTLELDPCFHRLSAGHRLVLLVAGGAYPRFPRNNGTGEPPADAVGLVPVTHVLRDGTLCLPLAA